MVGIKAFAYDIEVKNEDGITIYYNYFNDGKELEVAGANHNGTLVIPEEVTYMNRKRKVTSIGDLAFASNGLKSVTLPSSITYIQSYAFCMSGLTTINLPNNLTYIGERAFQESLFTTITIPNSVTTIEKYAFIGCKNIETLIMGNGITKIGYGAFSNCYNIRKVIIPDIAAWCKIEFGDYTANPVSFSRHIFSNENNEITNLIIPNGVTSISGKAFAYCEALTSLSIPNGVVSIGEKAFYNCKSISSVTIPSTVTSIDANAFENVDITTVISHVNTPFTICGKSSEDRTFSQNTFNNATLYVPVGTIDKYKNAKGWKDFLFIEEETGGGGNTTIKKCEKPTISYVNGKLIFTCNTEGATCEYNITDADIKHGSGQEVQLTVTYNISVYAKKAGYDNSETATVTLCWIDLAPKTEGITNEVSKVAAKALLIKSNGGMLIVEGLDDGTNVAVYSVSGQMAGSAKAKGNQASLITNIKKDEVAIIKIGEKTLKTVMQ